MLSAPTREVFRDRITGPAGVVDTPVVWWYWNRCDASGGRFRKTLSEMAGMTQEEGEIVSPPDCKVRNPAVRERPLPPLSRRVLNLSGALVKHVLAGAPEVPPEVEKERYALCRACEFYRPSDDKCSQCGCSLLGDKTKWATQSCPIGKWGEWQQ